MAVSRCLDRSIFCLDLTWRWNTNKTSHRLRRGDPPEENGVQSTTRTASKVFPLGALTRHLSHTLRTTPHIDLCACVGVSCGCRHLFFFNLLSFYRFLISSFLGGCQRIDLSFVSHHLVRNFIQQRAVSSLLPTHVFPRPHGSVRHECAWKKSNKSWFLVS